MKRIIMDCDPGIDDALAIILALKSQQVQIDGITTVAGNSTLENATVNALKVITLLRNEKIPVYKGAEKPLKREPLRGEEVHGKDGLGENNLPPPKVRWQNTRAHEFIISHVLKNPNEISVIATGPLTNVAQSILSNPEICSKIKELVIMGGAIFQPGNITPAAEFNIYLDPEAADVVFSAAIKNVTLVPLDVTHKVILTPVLLQKIKRTNDETGLALPGFVHKIVKFYYKFYMDRIGFKGCPLHDPLAMGVLINPSFVQTKPLSLRVITISEQERGHIEVDKTKAKPTMNVCLKVDSQKFLKFVIDTINLPEL